MMTCAFYHVACTIDFLALLVSGCVFEECRSLENARVLVPSLLLFECDWLLTLSQARIAV